MRTSPLYLEKLAKLIRYFSLISTTAAGSGHPTSSMSAADMMAVLMFGGFFKFDVKKPDHPNNDRLIFSKGHASPLFYATWAAAGTVTEKELLTLRKFKSRLEGHPTMRFKYTEAATGSLGQGLSIGVGMALTAKYIDKLLYRTYVLLGDSEMAEGSVWEAINSAAFYKLNNLIAMIDVNRLGQRGETMYGHEIAVYKKKLIASGWDVIIADGHSIRGLMLAFREAASSRVKPVMIVAQTLKGKGVSFLEDKEGWHGKALDKDQLKDALKEMKPIDKKIRGTITLPADKKPHPYTPRKAAEAKYAAGKLVATRKAYGDALVSIHARVPTMVVLDAEVSNSTHSAIFGKRYPKRFFEMYIAEQNMVGVAAGISRRGYIPFISTFAAFFTRAFDQIRMARYSEANIKFVGSHAGVSIGEDGASQMGIEDFAMFRSILNSVVLYPSDAYATIKLVAQAAKHKGMVYIRTTRMATPIVYKHSTSFPIGGSKVLRKSKDDVATVVAAGVTLHETLKAYEDLKKKGIAIRVIDLYSIKPVDAKTLKEAAKATGNIIVAEDHVAEGGIADAVRSVLINTTAKVYSLAVRKIPRSGTPAELLDYEQISAKAIVTEVLRRIKRGKAKHEKKETK